jgi:hypothetical protein
MTEQPSYKYNRHYSCVIPFPNRYRIFCLMTAIILLITLVFTTRAFAAEPSIAWNKTINNESGTFDDVRVIAVNDGYVIAASYNWDNHQSDLILVKTDREGNIIWNRSYYGFYQISSLIAVDDGYTVTGITSKDMKTLPDFVPKSLNAFLARFDLDGNMIWWKLYNWRTDRNAVSIIPVSGGYVMAGTIGTHTLAAGSLNAYLVRTDTDGNEIWNRTYGDPLYNDYRNRTFSVPVYDKYFYAILPSDDGYVLAGQTNGSYSWINGTAWLIKTDRDGNEIWNRTYIKGYTEAITNASDGYVLLVQTYLGYHLIKTDNDGNAIWDYDLGNYRQLSLAAVPDGYVLTGEIYTPGNPNSQISLMKTDRNGNMRWNTTYAMAGSNYDSRMIFDRSAYVIVGKTKANSTTYNASIFLLKTRPEESGAMPSTPAASLVMTTLAVIIATIAVRPRK